jgi:nicotinate-nucleotide adenylyltransferase
MKAVGIFGGTFDPVHHGHLITARSVYEQRGLEKIIFIPAFISPHKLDKPQSSTSDRYNILITAIDGIPYFEASDIEIKKKEISYTIETIIELKKIYKSIELIIGYDNLLNFGTWKNPDEILENVTLIVLNRKVEEEQPKTKFYNKAIFLNTPLIEISSTDIRKRVSEGLDINYLVPQKVMEYIYDFNLYKRDK